MKRASVFLAILPFLLLALTAAAQGALYGTVYQTANVRSGPDTRFPIVEQLSEDTRVQIDGRDDDSRWLHVLLPSGKAGWLPAFTLIVDGDPSGLPVIEATSTPEAETSVSVISYGRVNVRSGPGIDYDIVGQLDVSEQAQAIARSDAANDWLMIQFDDATGWVAYFTVNVQGDPAALPVLVPDSSGQSLIPPSQLIHARFNVRLHDQPQLDSPAQVVVPFDSEVTPISRSADGLWLLVGYKDAQGWGVTQLFDITPDALQALPISAQATPEATAEP